MELFIGTSGWAYRWNKRGLDWYARESGFNAVELNMSFYRLPQDKLIRSWVYKSSGLRWIVKVNRMITHICKFTGESLNYLDGFLNLFKPLNSLIDFYLFQMPPSLHPDSLNIIEDFFKQTGLTGRVALEARSVEWFKDDYADWAGRQGVVFVSVDSPKIPLKVYKVNGIVYLRMHGRSAWYNHYYSDRELEEAAGRILELKPDKVYVFFNNGDGMLDNGRRMLQILKDYL